MTFTAGADKFRHRPLTEFRLSGILEIPRPPNRFKEMHVISQILITDRVRAISRSLIDNERTVKIFIVDPSQLVVGPDPIKKLPGTRKGWLTIFGDKRLEKQPICAMTKWQVRGLVDWVVGFVRNLEALGDDILI